MELVSASKGSANNLQLQRLPPLDKGSRYTLANNAIAHSIPPISALNSGAEHQSGVIDTWPAHSSNQKPSNVHLSLNKFNNLGKIGVPLLFVLFLGQNPHLEPRPPITFVNKSNKLCSPFCF